MSTQSVLQAKPRDGAGKGAARKLRATGLVPAVVYGKRLEKPQHLAVDPLAVKEAINTPARTNTLIKLKVDGKDERQVLLKDFQLDPVTRELLHVDFIDVREDEKVKVNVPIELTGRPEGVTEGGILSVMRREIEVWALPRAIPEKIVTDVSHLKIAQALHINEIKMPAGVEVKSNINYTIAVVAVPEKEEVVAPAAVPGAEGVAAPGAEGAAPAAAGAPGAPGAAAPAAAEAKPAEGKPGAAPSKAAPSKKEEKKK